MKALELAKMFGNCDRWTELKDSHYDQAATELRRLAEVNAELLEAAKQAKDWIADRMAEYGWPEDRISNPPEGSHLFNLSAAIAKAKEQQ